VPYDGAAESLADLPSRPGVAAGWRRPAAREAFEKILQHPTWTFWPPLAPLSHLGRARAAVDMGDVETASRSYQDLFALWREADADLPVLIEARRECARLSR
jgi:hypothetical protein